MTAEWVFDSPRPLRPVQPSIRREIAEYMMIADPRCQHTATLIASRGICPDCHRSLDDYLSEAPEVWPA